MSSTFTSTWHRAWNTLGQGVGLGALVGIAAGTGSAVFLWLLQAATSLRASQEYLVYALPLAGLLLGWLYERWGQSIKAGNNLVIDTICDGGDPIPLRMTPMVLLGTVATHLFGGSAGREGTAVQMGASMADWWSQRFGKTGAIRQQMLIAGVAGGFGSVFGTPIAGAVFALEIVALGRARYPAVLPALVAAVIGDVTTRQLFNHHTPYASLPSIAWSSLLVAKWAMFAAAIAATVIVFIELSHWLKRQAEQRIARLPWRMCFGGALIVVLWQAMGTSDYLGLGIPTVLRAFHDPSLPSYAFAVKIVFTAITLGVGFLGGEVTPLFFIGATLGNVTSRYLDLPLALGAGVGMVAAFAAAANTPIALTVMAAELFGFAVVPHAALVCLLAYLMTGRRSIYPAQQRRMRPS